MANLSPAPARPSAKAARTRRAILAAAERRFAQDGFDRTRLEDVAADVGIRRASIVYHFKDKQALYEAVVADLFQGLHTVIRSALESKRPPLSRVETAVSSWVDYVAGRPALARVMLREVADGVDGEHSVLARQIRPIAMQAKTFLDEWKRSDWPRPTRIEPAHVASIITGATVFFVAALPRLLMETGFDPLSRTQLKGYRDEILRLTWQSLGVDAPNDASGGEQPTQERDEREQA